MYYIIYIYIYIYIYMCSQDLGYIYRYTSSSGPPPRGLIKYCIYIHFSNRFSGYLFVDNKSQSDCEGDLFFSF